MKFERGKDPRSSMNIGEIADAEEVHCIDICYRAYYEAKIDPKKQYPENWRLIPSMNPLYPGPYHNNQYTEGAISLIDDYLEWSLERIKEENWDEFGKKIDYLCRQTEKYNTGKGREERKKMKEYRKIRKKWGEIVHIDIKGAIIQVSCGDVGANMPLSHLSDNIVQYNGKLYVMPNFFEKNPENIFLSR
jgi:hypothetical protein